MSMAKKPRISAIEVSDAGACLQQLVERVHAGEEIVLTLNGKPVSMLIDCENMKVLSSVGGIHYELPLEMGGFDLMTCGPGEVYEQKAAELYKRQFED